MGFTMDLKNIASADLSEVGVVFELLHPATGEVIQDEKGKAFFAKLQGQNSPAYRKLVNSRIRKMQAQQAKRGKPPVRTIEDVAKEDSEELAALTLELYVVEDGKKVAQSQAEFERVYSEYDWIREQLNEELRNVSAFYKG